MSLNIDKLLKEMTLEEKAGLCSGADFWHTKAVERLGLPSVMMSDGPHGLRKKEVQSGIGDQGDSVKAVCFPAGCALASSFDRDLMQTVGETLGKEARCEGLHTVLGPAVNIKRSPLCGRNFEYLSEDPYLAGEMAAAYIKGIQNNQVGVSLKHFAANNQEYRRMSMSEKIDERTLREIYLTVFEIAVKKSQPWALMCSYNRINGTYSCENEWLLTKVLREEWGYKGIVMTDWGAMNRRCDALRAGLELEMPSSGGGRDRQIVRAVKEGTLSQEVLDRAVRRLLEWIDKGLPCTEGAYDKEAHHEISRRAADGCAVLLKNEGDILPLKRGSRIAVIGGFAAKPRYQGGGSSHVNSTRVTSAVEAMSGMPGIVYAEGFGTESDTLDQVLLAEAVDAAKNAETAVIFAGLPDIFESEGYDRSHMDLPACQNAVIKAVSAVQPNTIVVLHNGSPVTMPWVGLVKGILELYLAGEGAGEAACDILFGDVNPSGKLAESFPLRLEDTPCYLDFPGAEDEVTYSEGVYVGYRFYDARKMNVLFPFGHGLSYTKFQYTNLSLSSNSIRDTDTLRVSVSVKNVGARVGKEVVQLYVAPLGGRRRPRPARELKGFEKVSLLPGEEKVVTFQLEKRSFACYETKIGDWYAESGDYEILAGGSSRELPLSGRVHVESTVRIPFRAEDSTTVEDVLKYGRKPELFHSFLESSGILGLSEEGGEGLGAGSAKMMEQMIRWLPLHAACMYSSVTPEAVEQLIEQLNKAEE